MVLGPEPAPLRPGTGPDIANRLHTKVGCASQVSRFMRLYAEPSEPVNTHSSTPFWRSKESEERRESMEYLYRKENPIT